MINKIIRNFIAKQMAGRSDDGIMITLRDPQKVELGENIMADLLMRNGIDPKLIKSEQQLKNILNQIEAASKKQTGIRNTESAKVFDLEGKEIPKGSQIMGGKAIDDDLPPPGSRGGKDDIAAPVQSAEETLKDMIMAENKKNIAKIKNRKIIKDAVENASPGFVKGDRKYNAQLVADDLADKKFGKDFSDLDQRQQMDLYDEALEGLSEQTRGMPDPEDFAKGGIARIGLKDGMNRRTFLKFLAGAASIPIIGKVFKPFKIGKKITQVPIIKTADVAGKPEWFDQLVNKVILEGDDVSKRFATQERQVVHMKKIDDETSVTVTQDLNDGSIMVDVDDPIRNVMGETGDDTSLQMLLKKNPGDESNPAGADEFSFTEADMRNYMDGPDDYTTEFVENTVNKMSDLTSDLGKIKSYATGKKPTMKQIVESKKRQDMVELAERNPAEYAAGRGPDGPDPDYPDDIDFASGGIARMLGE